MKFAVGSESVRKVVSSERIVASLADSLKCIVVGSAALSGVSETPRGEETLIGARNRAQHALDLVPDAVYGIGPESGLVDRYGSTFEEAWCVVRGRDGAEYLGYSSGLAVPRYVLERMEVDSHAVTMAELEREHHIQNPVSSDTWATYSGGQISRERSIEEAVRNALVQVFANDRSFYRLP